MISGETASWEDSHLQLIIEDESVLQSFQTLKYANGECLSKSKVMMNGAADFTGDQCISGSFGRSVCRSSQTRRLIMK
jgi:hypothetical protein